MQCCETPAEERSAGNPHATFCGNRRRATASGDPVGGEQSPFLPRRLTDGLGAMSLTPERSKDGHHKDVGTSRRRRGCLRHDFMKRQHAAGKPFFLYLPFSMEHAPNLPSKAFAGKSRIGDYGDKMMEGDFHVGQILDALKDLGIDDDTIVMFASDNGPWGEDAREFGNQGTPDMGNSGPFRGELGEVTEGSIRTFAFVRWPGHVKPDTTSYAMFSIMDFMPTLASIVGGRCRPTDRSTASTRATCCSARARSVIATAC